MWDKDLFKYQVGSRFLQTLPQSSADFLGKNLAKIYATFPSQKKALVKKNLTRALGKTPTSKQVRNTFASYASYFIDASILPNLPKRVIEEKFTAEGFENIENAIAQKKGAILALPHMGSWEWAGAWLSQVKGLKTTAVMEPVASLKFEKWVVEHRKKFGIDIIVLSPKAGTQLVKALHNNHVVCLLSDRYISGAGIELDFFNEKTTLPAGPATLSFRTSAPIIPVCIYPENKVHHAIIRPPIKTQRKGKLKEDVQRVTEELTKELEALIRTAPEQWHLMSPNWPSDKTGDKTGDETDGK